MLRRRADQRTTKTPQRALARPCRLRHDLAALGLLAALAVGFLWRCNLGGKLMFPADLLLIMEPWKHYSGQFPEFHRVGNPILDATQQMYPWRKYAGESLRRGEIPLWNPYVMAGTPFVANNQSAVFYPETWLHALMPSERALGWATSLYFFLAGAFMYWFLRVIGLRWAACVLGAIAFMFNGFGVGWLTLPAFRSVFAWLPGMLATFELALRRRQRAWLALGALLTGEQFLVGNLHISLYALIVFTAYVAFRCVNEARGGLGAREALKLAAGAACALVSGGALAAVQLVPVLELVRMSSRAGGLPYDQLMVNALAPQALLTALMPDLFGNPVDYNHWGANLGRTYRAYTETAFYVGLAPVLLAPLAWRSRRREAAFWLALALVGALLAIGSYLNAVLYYAVPVFRSLPGVGRAVSMIATALAVLGALGLHGLLEGARTRQVASLPDDDDRRDATCRVRSLLKSAAVIGLVGLVGGLWVWMVTAGYEPVLPGLGTYTLAQIGRFAALLMVTVAGGWMISRRPRLGAAVILAALVVDLYLFVDKFTPAVQPKVLQIRPQTIETIQRAPGNPRALSLGTDAIHRMAPNTAMIVGLEDIQGSDSLEIGIYRRLLTAASTEALGFAQPNPALPVIDLLGVRFVHSSVPLQNMPKLKLLTDQEGYLYENTQALPRAFTVPWYRRVAANDLQEVTAARFQPAREVLVNEGGAPLGLHRAAPVLLDHAAPLRTTAVTVAEHHANSVLLKGDFQADEVVVLADAYYPGWYAVQARSSRGVDLLPIVLVDNALRAVVTRYPTPIWFFYWPGSFAVGAFVSLLVAGALAGLGAAAWAGRRGR